jgi:opine dehydrogenase
VESSEKLRSLVKRLFLARFARHSEKLKNQSSRVNPRRNRNESSNIRRRPWRVLAPVIKNGNKIEIVGEARTGFAKIHKVTTNIKEAVQGANLIMNVNPAFMHEAFIKEYLPYLEDNQTVVYNTGYWACMRFAKRLKARAKVKVAQTALLVYSCRKEPGKAWVEVPGLKKNLLISALPATDTSAVMETLQGGEIFGGHPKLTAAKNVLNIDLENLNNTMHPAITLANTATVDKTKGNFLFYKEGVTPSVGKLMDSVDTEQTAVAKKLGMDKVPAKDWLYKYYGAKGRNMYEAIMDCTCYHVPSEKGPNDFHHRYIIEDVPYGLVPTSTLGDVLGVHTPTMKAIIQFASVINETDYLKEGNNAEKMGLKGKTAEQIMNYANIGT